MTKIGELFRSRKFWAMVMAVLGAVSGWLTGEISASVAIPTIVGAISVWIHAQGGVDAAKAASNGTTADGR